jgi:hypothetical protein
MIMFEYLCISIWYGRSSRDTDMRDHNRVGFLIYIGVGEGINNITLLYPGQYFSAVVFNTPITVPFVVMLE